MKEDFYKVSNGQSDDFSLFSLQVVAGTLAGMAEPA